MTETPRRTRLAWRLLALRMTLVVGLVLGLALGSGRLGDAPDSVPAAGPSATRPLPAPATSIVARQAASSACLETARRADEVINLLINNRRSRAAEVLVAYTIASRQCRRDASP